MSVDIVNALFEFAAALAILNHCRAALKDRAVAGVSVLSTIFFTIWGAWNVFYYPALGQIWSFAAGLFVFAANAFWISLIVHFRYNKSRRLH